MRPSAEEFKKKVGDKLVNIAELGVADGRNAVSLYYNFRVGKLWLIDSWAQDYGKHVNEWALSVFRKFDKKRNVFIIKANAIDAVELIPDNALDYIYIDDLHAAKHVKKEIDLYWPKMKAGSMISGHDYTRCLIDRVKDGIDEYVKINKLKLYNRNEDWWIWK